MAARDDETEDAETAPAPAAATCSGSALEQSERLALAEHVLVASPLVEAPVSRKAVVATALDSDRSSIRKARSEA